MAERTRGYAHRVNVNAPAELVWRGLIDPELLAAWCGPGARVTARSGGSYFIRLNGEIEREAHIDVFDPGRRLRLIYLPPRGLPESEAVTIDDFILDTEQGVAVLRLLGSGFPPDELWDPHYVQLRAGWALALARLKVCAEQLASGKVPTKAPTPGTTKSA
ncbi:MAG TPA: SRPBCC domain-containing protein [Steroidobacteraceae bacterium]|nr:SRPBCC domain-containing protein [Steroidobacteraceae bacterium]